MFRGPLYGLSAATIWGGLYMVSDIVLEIIPPFTLLTIRLLLGIAVLLPIVWWQRRGSAREALNCHDLIMVLAVGTLDFGVSVGAQFVGTDKSTAINGSLVTSASPAFILLFSAIVLREKLTFQKVLAVLLATVGVFVIVDLTKVDFSSATFQGNVALAVAAITWGLYSVLIRWVSIRLDTLVETSLAFCGGLLLTIPSAAGVFLGIFIWVSYRLPGRCGCGMGRLPWSVHRVRHSFFCAAVGWGGVECSGVAPTGDS